MQENFDLEKNLHHILLSVAPGLHDNEEQSWIIATAAYHFNKNNNGIRLASKDRLLESKMVSAILESINEIADDSSEDQTDFSIDATGLSPEQVLRKAAHNVVSKNSHIDFLGKDMDVINSDDLDVFLPDEKEEENPSWSVNDSQPRHKPTLYQGPGEPKHRTDSQVRTQ